MMKEFILDDHDHVVSVASLGVQVRTVGKLVSTPCNESMDSTEQHDANISNN